ncbi:MAG: hypothetical protein JNL57_05785 [Bacteroidetes bacterium]|nr:hypothetical protein [Bacteroidota bacterium]
MITMILLKAAGGILLFLLAGVAVWWLWNRLVPQLFHGPSLKIRHALGLLLLSRLLLAPVMPGWGMQKQRMEHCDRAGHERKMQHGAKHFIQTEEERKNP